MIRKPVFVVLSLLLLACASVHAQSVGGGDEEGVEDTHTLNEVEVAAHRQRYRRKGNPAVDVMRRVMEAKRGSDPRARDYYSYTKYERMTLSLNEFTERVMDENHFRRLPMLREHVERHPITGKLILPLSVEEKVMRRLYRREPREDKTIVEGERTEGITELMNAGAMLTGMMEDVFRDVDIYDDNVRLLQHHLTSPLGGEAAIRFYRYFLADTLTVDGEKCYLVAFAPGNSQDYGFTGELYVAADSTWRVRRVRLSITGSGDANFVERIDIMQEFSALPTGENVMTDSRMIAQMKVTSQVQKFQVERVAHCSGHDFAPQPDRLYRQKGVVRTEAAAGMRDRAYWEAHRPDGLSHGEEDMGLFMASVRELKFFKPVVWVAKAFVENYLETSVRPDRPSLVDIGPVNTMIGGNFVEGFHLRAGAQTTANLNKHWFAKGYAKYGFGDRRWKGQAEFTYSFNEKRYMPHEFPVRSLTVSYQKDIMSPSDKFSWWDKDNVFTALKWTSVKHMNYYERINLLYDWETEGGVRMSVQLRKEWDRGAGDLFYQTLANGAPDAYDVWSPSADNPTMGRITYAEAAVGIRYQPGVTYVNTKQRRRQTNHDSPSIEFNYTFGMWGTQHEEHPYNFTEATFYKRFWLNSWGKVDCTLRGGVQWNRVPFPFLCMPAANLSYLIEEDAFRLVNNMEFLNDRYVSLHLMWDINGKIFNRVPLLRRLKWREAVGCNVLWGMLTDKNNPYLPQNQGSEVLMFFPGSYQWNGTFSTMTCVMDRRKPYVEVVAGIHNIFRVFHIEYVRRVNYAYSGAHRNGVRLMFRLMF